MRSLVIGGTHSGAGKTTAATALMAALTRRGLRVQPFKVGPDFIDPGFHETACGRPSRNLDGCLLSREANLRSFARAAHDADVAIVEGVMGLFDGRSAASAEGSTAEMAQWLGAPVLLVVDASAMARSAAALVRGFETFEPSLDLAGVLFNRVGGPGHGDLLREALAANCRAKPVGFLPENSKIALPSRHLGLTLAAESLNPELLAAMADWIEENVDLDALLEVARETNGASAPPAAHSPHRVRIGVARDAAFCFYYQDNLDLLAEAGAELVPFSPIADAGLPPDLGGLYCGGGYPELHAARLSANRPMLDAVGRFVADGGPVYAECGGFMWLTEAIIDQQGCEHPMAGIFPTRARMQPRLAAIGYREPAPAGRVLWLDEAHTLRGHEFRYSTIDPMPPAVTRVYRAPAEGFAAGSVLGSYIHLHFGSCPAFAEAFVDRCATWRQGLL